MFSFLPSPISLLPFVHCFCPSSHVWHIGWRIWKAVEQHMVLSTCHPHNSTSSGRREERREKVKVPTECVNLVNRRAHAIGLNMKKSPFSGSSTEGTHWGTVWVVHLEDPPPDCPLHKEGMCMGPVSWPNLLTVEVTMDMQYQSHTSPRKSIPRNPTFSVPHQLAMST